MATLLPVTTTILAAVVAAGPLHIRGFAGVAPDFVLMATYYWTIHRPDLLWALALFTIGTLQDLLCGCVPGTTALLLLLCRANLLALRRHFIGRPFAFLWAGFTLLTGMAMLFSWSLNSLLAKEILDWRTPTFAGVLTIFLFPAANFLLSRTQRVLMGAA